VRDGLAEPRPDPVRKGADVKLKIDGAQFGSITVDGETYDHDIVIRLSGTVKKRKK
jgi:hypothetical protein